MHYICLYIRDFLTKKIQLDAVAGKHRMYSSDEYHWNMHYSKYTMIRHAVPAKIFNMGFRNYFLTAIANLEVTIIKRQSPVIVIWNR